MAIFALNIIDYNMKCVGEGPCVENDKENQEKSNPDNGVFSFNSVQCS